MTDYPDYARATNAAYQVLWEAPCFQPDVNVFMIAGMLENCGIKPYSSVPYDGERHIFEEYSKHGFLATDEAIGKSLIFYNNKDPLPVIRFTLAHEIGHYALGHSDKDGPAAEKEANCFARNLLCPVPAADFFRLNSVDAYAAVFKVSRSMASITLSMRHFDRQNLSGDLYDRIAWKVYRFAKRPWYADVGWDAV